jgi:MFS family permease
MTRLRLGAADTFRSLQIRNFRLFFVGQGISQTGHWLSLIAQTLLVLQLTDSGIALGLLAAAQFGPVLLLGAWAGLVADRSEKRTLLIRVQVFAMAQAFTMGALAFMDQPPLLAIYAVAAMGGVATAFDNPARRSFVVEMVPEDHVTNAVSLNSALMTGSRVVGPALGGLLVATVGYGWTFWLDGLSFLAVIAGLRAMDPTALRSALRYAWSVPELRVPLVMMAVIGTLAFNFQTVLPLFVTRDLGGSDVTFSLLMSVVSVGSLAGALAAARRKDLEVHLVSVAALAFGVTMLGLALAPGQQVAFAVGVAMGFASITFMTTSTAIVQLRADPSMRGRVLALQAIVFLGSTPIGGPVVGAVAEGLGARYGIGLGALAALGAGAYGLLTVHRTRRLEVTDAVTAEALADAATDRGAGPVVVRPSPPPVAERGGPGSTRVEPVGSPATAGRPAGPAVSAQNPAPRGATADEHGRKGHDHSEGQCGEEEHPEHRQRPRSRPSMAFRAFCSLGPPRAPKDPRRDERRLVALQDLERRYRMLADRDVDGSVRTLLEELRVATFAQSVGARSTRWAMAST